MGDPAELSADDRREALVLARRIIDSVVCDEPFPLTGLSDVAQGQVLRMAQALVELTERRS